MQGSISSLLLAAALTTAPVTHDIVTLKSMHDLAKITQHTDADTLAVFDVDYVLTHPSEAALQMPNIRNNMEAFAASLMSLTPQQRDRAGVMTVSSVSNELVEHEVHARLHELQSRGAKTIALTALLAGSLDHIENLPQWRVDDLARLGIDFSHSYPDLQPFHFDEFPLYQNHHPAYNGGVLFSNGEHGHPSKGQVLVQFLKRTGWTPKKIIFVDDRIANVTNVQAVLAQEYPEIEYIGVHYVGAAFVPADPVDAEVFQEKISYYINRAKN